jgi:hypothetical protein
MISPAEQQQHAANNQPQHQLVQQCLPSMMMMAILLAQAPVSLMKLLDLLFLGRPMFGLLFLPLLSDPQHHHRVTSFNPLQIGSVHVDHQHSISSHLLLLLLVLLHKHKKVVLL